jgi:hypothetical protein
MKKIYLFILLVISSIDSFSQSCTDINLEIDANSSYSSDEHSFEIPLNDSWGIAMENQKAIIVFLQNQDGTANGGVLKNRNGYQINSAHDIRENLITQLVKMVGINFDDKKTTDVKLKNIPAKQIEYNHKVYNLNETYLMSGIIFMIVKDSSTYIFMFNSPREMKDCYLPFFKEIMKNTYFGPEWY